MCSCAARGKFNILWYNDWGKVVCRIVEGCQPFLHFPCWSGGQWRSSSKDKHGCNAFLIWIISCSKSGTLSLIFFYCQNVLFVVRVPDWWGVLDMYSSAAKLNTNIFFFAPHYHFRSEFRTRCIIIYVPIALSAIMLNHKHFFCCHYHHFVCK